MTTVTNPDFESKIVRGQPDNAGKFASKDNSAPDISIDQAQTRTPQERR